MLIEQGFRGWKTYPDVRGLFFYWENPGSPITWFLLAFSLFYLLCLNFGASGNAAKAPESWSWGAEFPITNEWSEVRIPFSSFYPGRGPQGQTKNISFDSRKVQWIDWTD